MSQPTAGKPANQENDIGQTIVIIMAPIAGLVATCLCCACFAYYFGMLMF